MPLINESHDSLPYIDPDFTAQARANAEHQIASELPPEHATTSHPSMPSLPEPRFTPLMQQELDRKAAGEGLAGGIDVTRYEAPEPPAPSGEGTAPDLDSWRQTLRKAYTASHHLTTRHENLGLLEESGKNAWLIGNSQLEELLRGTEKELAETREGAEEVNRQRKTAQENGRAELVGLQEAWRRGVGAVLDVEVASEELRARALGLRREMAGGGQR